MRTRLIFGLIASAVVAGLVAWGFIPGGATRQTAASRTLPSQSVPAVAPSFPSSSSRTPAGKPPVKGRWHLALNASFSGSRLDTALWSTCYPWMDSPSGCTNFTNALRGKEYEWYLPSQVRVKGGSLELTAQRTLTPGRNSHGRRTNYACRSGMVTSYPGFHFTYGYVKILAHIPPGAGLWSALWLAASNQHWPPEIDIMEHWGRPSDHVAAFFHPVAALQFVDHYKMPNISTGWHTFGLLWTPSELTWYADGHRLASTRIGVPHQSMYLVADLAEGLPPRQNWGCEGTMAIRSVQIWQPRH